MIHIDIDRVIQYIRKTHILHPLRGFLICETHQLHVLIEALQNHIIVACNKTGKSRDSTWFQKKNSAKNLEALKLLALQSTLSDPPQHVEWPARGISLKASSRSLLAS